MPCRRRRETDDGPFLFNPLAGRSGHAGLIDVSQTSVFARRFQLRSNWELLSKKQKMQRTVKEGIKESFFRHT
jgi:hypothetical protein